MKVALSLISLALASTYSFSQTQSREYVAVKEIVEKYFSGCKRGDTSLIQEAFHPSCKLKHITSENTLFEAGLTHFINFLQKNGPMPILQTQVLEVDVFETAASVKALFLMDGFIYLDYLNLLKVEGEWKIVDKIYVRKNDEKA